MARNVVGAATFPFGVAVGVGVGGAVGGVITPRLQDLQNLAWQAHPALPIEALSAASLVASGERSMAWGKAEAELTGVNGARFEALVDLWDTAPNLATLTEARRRSLITLDDFREGAKKGNIEDKWLPSLVALLRELLTPSQLANAVVQGFRDFDAAADDAELQGLTRDDFQTMVDVTGLPPGPETLQAWARRGIITEAELAQGIREGHTKVKYIDEYLESLQPVLSAVEYAGLHLRGHITTPEMNAGGALTGYSPEQMNLLYLNRGRPATSRQIHIGYARGGRLQGSNADERTIHRQAIAQSNIRPEYEPLLWAQRHTYPSAFVIRALVQDGTFDQATGERILIESGWVPEYAELAATSWSGGQAGPTSKWADRAKSSLFTALHSDYVDGGADEQVTREGLGRVGAATAESDAIIGLWEWERQNVKRDLTQAQILKLYKKAVWTRDQALAALLDLGMSDSDANDLLDAV